MDRTNRFKSLSFLVLVLLLCGMTGLAHAGELSAKALATAQAQGKVRVLVMLRDTAPKVSPDPGGTLRKQAVANRVDTVLARLPSHGHVLRRRFSLVPALALDADASTLQRLRDDPDVLRIDVDLPGSAHGVAPDESSVLNNVSPLVGMGFDGAGMKVAVIDSGVDTDHPDLQSRLIAQQCFCSNISGSGGCCPNGQASQSGAGAAEDGNGHGTNVSGIIAGAGNIAPRGALPAAQLVVVRVLDNNGSFCCSSDIVAAMDWIAANHPDIDAVNLSLGTSTLFSGNCDGGTSFTEAMASAVRALTARGAVVTASTGNQGNSDMVGAPACVADVVGVAATWDFSGGSRSFLGCTESSTAPKMPACFSNRSTTTDLYAAGAFVTSTGLAGGTSTYGGTSQAAPMVAACAAAMKHAAPHSIPDERAYVLRWASTTDVTDTVSGRSYPFFDCVAAVRSITPLVIPLRSLDFNGDGKSDIFWRNTGTGANGIWKSASASSPQAVTNVWDQAFKVAGIGDFNGDFNFDILWRNTSTGANGIWRSANSATPQSVTAVTNQAWQVAGIGDFDGNGQSDILWYSNATGAGAIWRSANYALAQNLTTVTNLDWKIVGVGDFNDDGKSDILWRNGRTGANAIWLSGNAATQQTVTAVTSQAWQVAGTGDYNGDGKFDILWRNAITGANVIWKSANYATQQPVTGVTNPEWKISGSGDYNGDGVSDILWRNVSSGANVIWRSANSVTPQAVSPLADVAWRAVQ